MVKASMITASSLLTRVPPLFLDLSKILSGELDCSHSTLTKYSADNSPYIVMPQAVIFPKTATDIKHVLSFAREYTMPVTVRGKGGARTGGALGEGIILDMTRYFNQIRNINMLENTVTVDAGVTVSSFLEKLNGWHYDIPLLTLQDKEATIGALLATKSSSPGSFSQGTIREWVEGLTIVVDTGEEHRIADGITPSGRLLGIYQSIFPLLTKESGILRAAKPTLHDDATGYNLWSTSIGPRQLIDQIVGSEGTLGIVTSVTFRISPIKKHTLTTCIPLHNKETIDTYVKIAKDHHATHIFMYDEAFMQLSERYHPTLVPFFANTPYVLLVTHSNSDKEKLHQLERSFRQALPLEEYLLKSIPELESVGRITDTAYLYSLLDAYTNSVQIPITVGNGLIVPLPKVAEFLNEIEGYLNTLGKLYIISGNIGSGHVSVTTLFDPHSKNYNEETTLYSQTLFSILKEYGGGMSAVGGEGLTRTPYLSMVYNDAILNLFKQIKDAWDPLSILNPGKKGAVTTRYLEQHLGIQKM